MKRQTGFTLIELLTVLAILVVLAGVLFPVFLSAKARALQTVCMSNFKQVSVAHQLYLNDYDDFPLPAKYTIGDHVNASNDRTWVQILLPYIKSYGVFQCPADYTQRRQVNSTFDEDLVPGDTYAKYYQSSQIVDIGYNYIYHSPIVDYPNYGWVAAPQRRAIENPSKSVLFVDSAQAQDARGNPMLGGSYLVVPPCRFSRRFGDSFNIPIVNGNAISFYRAHPAWEPATNGGAATYGGAYPWHLGRMNVMFADGNTRSLRPRQLTAGCNVSGAWTGMITDDAAYLWDFN